MDQIQHQPIQSTLPIPIPNTYYFPTTSPRCSLGFEIRLFYLRISPIIIAAVPNHLTLRHTAASTTLRRDRLDTAASEVTYVGTDPVRTTGGIDFEVLDGVDVIIRGSIGMVEYEWSMDCYAGGTCATSFSRCFEVYIAGRWGDTPVILTKMVSVSPRRKSSKYSKLDSISEVSDEVENDRKVLAVVPSSLIRHRKLQLTGNDDECDTEGKITRSYYPEDLYIDEDGQLSWFNAGVRVGVGIGLGMCLGLGIGVGLLMRSYQATTRNFRRRFF